jgi:hypothetical protein
MMSNFQRSAVTIMGVRPIQEYVATDATTAKKMTPNSSHAPAMYANIRRWRRMSVSSLPVGGPETGFFAATYLTIFLRAAVTIIGLGTFGGGVGGDATLRGCGGP